MGIGPEEISALLGELYDAALEPERWPGALSAVVRAVGAHCGTLQADNINTRQLVQLVQIGMPENAVTDYLAHYASIDPRVAHAAVAGPGVVFDDSAIVESEREMDRSEYYAWLGHYDYRYFTGGLLHADGPIQTAFSIQRARSQGPLTRDDQHLLAIVAPHFRRSIRLGTELGHLRIRSAATGEALDRVHLGIAIVGISGRVLHANRALCEMAASGDGISFDEQGFRFGHRVVQARAQRMLADAVATGLGQGVSAGGTVQVTRPSGRRPYVVTVSPLPNRTSTFLGGRSAAIVTVSDPERTPSAPAETLRKLYGMTPRECQLAQELLAGLTVREAAAKLGMADRTARTHLSAMLLKTGTSRQTELMRLLLQTLPT